MIGALVAASGSKANSTMNHTRLLIFCTLAAGLVSQACQNPQPGPADPGQPGAREVRFRVKSLSEDLPDNAARITLFNYDNQNRLSSLLAYQTPDSLQANVERSTYQYDGQNRLIRQQRQLIVRPNTVFFTAPLVEAHQFAYNTTNQVSEIQFLSYYKPVAPGIYSVDPAVLNSPTTLTQLAMLHYDQRGQLVSLNKQNYFQGSPGLVATTNTYGYTDQNLTSASMVTQVSGTQLSNISSTIAYDNQRNPFYGSYVIGRYFGGISDFFQNLSTLSPHNITKLDGVSYRYEYNAAGLPTVRYTYSDKLVQTLRFTYEAY
jgi:hypothetical protein